MCQTCSLAWVTYDAIARPAREARAVAKVTNREAADLDYHVIENPAWEAYRAVVRRAHPERR